MLFQLYKVPAYYVSLALFGAMGLAFSVICRLSVCFPKPRRASVVRLAIQWQFSAFTRWLMFTGLVRIEYRHCENLGAGGRVVVANHPGLLDAVFLLARVPVGICIFKPSVARNPVLGAAAARAGYLPSDQPALGLVRAAAASLASGASLVVFPEGTRTPASHPVGHFKPGFAVIARQARATVQLVRITSTPGFLTKENACWKLPQLPARVVIEAGPCIQAATSASALALAGEVEAWFRAVPAPTRVTPAKSVMTRRRIPTLSTP
jgi:1-acyl-sn-glycerol-3-phosphate acyltransferase